MRESEKRIKEYQAMLPALKGKVASVAFFLFVAVVMATSVSFAWLTVSANPEASGITTTVAANGNLEIALSNSAGTEPAESMVGDSLLAITEKNLTWGNLINLSDASYGLSEIVLRPASLNAASLLRSPLYAAKYDSDGRVETLTSDFAYSNYDKNTGEFIVPGTTQYGVRAISSVTYTYAGGEKVWAERLQNVKSKLTTAQEQYNTLVGNDAYMDAIAKVMGIYLTDNLNGSKTSYSGSIPALYQMMVDLENCYKTTGEAIVYLANLQLMMAKGDTVDPYTLETLLAASASELTANGIDIDGFAQYKTDRSKYDGYMTTMEGIFTRVDQNGEAIYWTELKPIVNFLVDINSTEVDGLPVSSIGKDEAVGLLGNSNHTGIIQKGALLNMENLLGTRMFVENLMVSVTYMITLDLEADITTAATEYYLPNEVTAIEENDDITFTGSDPVAADTYGMAIDFWVRSNAGGDYLILEGNVLTTQVQKEDADGNPYYETEEGLEVIRKTDEDDNLKYYFEDGTEYTVGEDEVLSVVYEDVVTGYEGENRVWDDEVLSENSATQGSGSCYIFYADSPQDQAQSLDLLEAMTVVFVDDAGKLLAYADMDTDSYYAQSGRVTVPLKLRTTSLNVGEDENGNTVYAITPLDKGVAKRITALIYVDGTRLMNTDVLANADIQGQLNIQFGSSAMLEPVVDDEIYFDEVHITGTATPNNFDFASNPDLDLTSDVTLTIDGVNPEKVTARFIRQINSTQGTRQQEITFSPNGDGTWSADMKFAAPGDFVLRTVWLDGVEYQLDEAVEVSISGFSISNVSWDYANNYATVLSAYSYATEDITVTFGGLTPNTVQGIFSNEENQQITVNFKRGTSSWAGTARFLTSGVYTMQYMLIDGEYYEVPASMQKTINLSLGMKAKVQISETSWEYEGAKTVNVYATIMDNKGEELTELENVSLQYMSQSSSLVENGLFSELTWNAANKRYEGKFDVEYAGAYEFGYLAISNSSINSADAPVITAIPPVPPSYYSNETEASIFAYGQDVSMSIALKDSNAVANGNIKATIYKLDANGNPEIDADGNVITFTIAGTSAMHIDEEGEESTAGINVTDWSFPLPTTDELTTLGYSFGQLGTWQMTEVSIVGAYVDGEISDEENPYIIDFADVETTIDDEMTVKVYGDGQTLNAVQFPLSVKANEGLVVEVRGAGGEVATGVTDVKVTYKLTSYATSSGNTSVGFSNSSSTITTYQNAEATLIENPSDNTQFILNADAATNQLEFLLPGTYTFQSVSFKIGNTTYTANVAGTGTVTLNSSAPSYAMSWQAPTVTIPENGISPAGNVTVNTGRGFNQKKGTATNVRTNAYNCTVHLTANFNGWWGSLSGYTAPSVTTTISNISSFTTASMIVESSGQGGDVTFEYSSTDTSSTKTVGSSFSIDRYTVGTAKGTHLTISGIVGNNQAITYVFDVNDITIKQPY